MSEQDEEEIRAINALKMHHRMALESSLSQDPTTVTLSSAVDKLTAANLDSNDYASHQSVCMTALNGPEDVAEYLQKVRWRIMAEVAPTISTN